MFLTSFWVVSAPLVGEDRFWGSSHQSRQLEQILAQDQLNSELEEVTDRHELGSNLGYRVVNSKPTWARE